MGVLEVPLNDDGSIGKLPEPLQKFFDTKFNEGYGKGAAKAAAEAATQLETQIAELKKGGLNPAEREKLKSMELDLSKAREDIALRDKNYEEANRIVAERHKSELKDRDDKVAATQAEVAKREARIKTLAQGEIGIAALKAGAREESLDELKVILGGRIGLDEHFEAIVLGADGKPALDKDGKPVSVEGFVSEYVNSHPHHKAAAPGRGGNAAGGRSLAGQKLTGVAAEKAAALEEVAKNPSIDNVARAFSRVGVA